MDSAQIQNKATSISLFSLKTVQMRVFHMSWFAFFLAFFGWFGIAPLMVIVRDDLDLTQTQIGNTIIASVAITIVARLVIGWLSDRIGPRRAYTWLLIIGSLPVMGIGLAQNYESFLLFPPRDRRDRRGVRHHAVPHFGDVRPERRRHRERDDGRLGQPRRRP